MLTATSIFGLAVTRRCWLTRPAVRSGLWSLPLIIKPLSVVTVVAISTSGRLLLGRSRSPLLTLIARESSLWPFNSGSTTIAAADGNGAIYLWLYKLIRTLQNPTSDSALSVAYSPDNSQLAVACGNGNVYVRTMST